MVVPILTLTRPNASTDAAPVLTRGWRLVQEPLSGWRDDDPDAVARCAIDPGHVIKNGDRYALAGLKMACLPCAGVAPPPAPVAPTPAARSFIGKAQQQFGGAGARQPRRGPTLNESRPCARPGCEATFTVPSTSQRRTCSPRCGGLLAFERSGRPRAIPTVAVVAVEAPPATATRGEAPSSEPRPRVALGPRHPERGTPVATPPARVAERPTRRAASREARTRTCAGCGGTFVVDRLASPQQFCGQACKPHHRRPKAEPAFIAPKPIAEPTTEASAATDPLQSCPCLRHAQERAEQTIPPLPIRIGRLETPSLPVEARR